MKVFVISILIGLSSVSLFAGTGSEFSPAQIINTSRDLFLAADTGEGPFPYYLDKLMQLGVDPTRLTNAEGRTVLTVICKSRVGRPGWISDLRRFGVNLSQSPAPLISLLEDNPWDRNPREIATILKLLTCYGRQWIHSEGKSTLREIPESGRPVDVFAQEGPDQVTAFMLGAKWAFVESMTALGGNAATCAQLEGKSYFEGLIRLREQRDINGETALFYAVRYFNHTLVDGKSRPLHFSIVDQLGGYGNVKLRYIYKQTNYKGETALDVAKALRVKETDQERAKALDELIELLAAYSIP